MTDMQTSLPLLIVRPFILNPVMHFSTQPLTGEMKCPTSHTFALRIPFYLPKYWCHTSTKLHQVFFIIIMSQHLAWSSLNDMIHSISLHDLFGPSILTFSLFTVASVYRRQILPKLHRLAVSCFNALTCPSPLQPFHQGKPCLDLLHFGHMTPCHVSYAMSSSITLYEHSINF